MKLTKTAGVLLAVLLVATAGVAAMPGNAPADSQAGQADDNYDDGANASNAPADAGPEMNDSETDEANAENADDRRGPPTDMPAQVPDHVSQIHDLVNQYLDGDIDNLGEHISDLMGGEDAADEESEDAEDSDEMEDTEDSDEDGADDEEMDDDADDDSEEDDEMDDDATATPA